MKFTNLTKTLFIMIMFLFIGDSIEANAEEHPENHTDFVRTSVSSGGPGAVIDNHLSTALTDVSVIVEKRLMEYIPSKKNYTDEELYILAHVICGEAQSYSDEEQLYVGSVVLNRVNSSRYPNTIKEVVFQKNQYACTKDGNYYRKPTERNWSNAKHLLENGSVLPSNVVYQSGAKQGKGVYIKTSRHYYCY